MKVTAFFLAAVMIGGITGCATVPSRTVDSPAPDSGYFLSLKQKGQLIGTGRIQDAQGIWYDVWVVPGYVQPAQRTRTYLKEAGSDLAEYFQREKYHDLADDSCDAFRWAYRDCLTDFMAKGVPRAWGRYWSAANLRTRQRVFGWWLAYPWALLEGTVDTIVRVPAGLAGTALGTVGGAAVVPGYYAVNSAAKASWHLAVDAVLFPAVACTWNTVVAPPLALIGQKPAPSRVDGFWVTELGRMDAHAISKSEPAATPTDVEALAAWGGLLVTVSQPYEDRRQALRKETQAQHEAVNRKSLEAEADIRSEEEASVRAIAADPSHKEALDYLRSRGLDPRQIPQMESQLRRYLEDRKNLSPGEINRILLLLRRYPLSAATPPPPIPSKTDPVQRSVEVIQDIH